MSGGKQRQLKVHESETTIQNICALLTLLSKGTYSIFNTCMEFPGNNTRPWHCTLFRLQDHLL